MTTPPKLPAHLRSVEAIVYRVPLATPVKASFGTMPDRPAVFVRLEDEDGCVGFGETWCNFPSPGAEHRARLIAEVLGPLFAGQAFDDPLALYAELTKRTEVLAIQSAEYGPIAQAIAGIDIAAWDLASRRANIPLWRALGGASPRVRAYASGINPTAPEKTVEVEYEKGQRAFKLKVGFGRDLDLQNIASVRKTIGPQAHFAIDANQAWSLATAMELAPDLMPFDLAWLEEPLRADVPWQDWRRLQQICSTPLAAGENITGTDGFDRAIAQNVLRFVQPDVAKWGGISGCVAVAKRVVASGGVYCPHFLGGGVGLMASAHLLAGVGGAGLLEIDTNDNPLREFVAAPHLPVRDGMVQAPERAGLGFDPDWDRIAAFKKAVYRYPN
jgi:L-alanine-DL-glutamate epimerase-like enolase superfamily enzyme